MELDSGFNLLTFLKKIAAMLTPLSFGTLYNRVSFNERPDIVAHKTRIEDGEDITVIGKKHKGMDLSDIAEKIVQWAVDRLKQRPQKVLGYRTPHGVFIGVKFFTPSDNWLLHFEIKSALVNMDFFSKKKALYSGRRCW